jgi:SlyX protein
MTDIERLNERIDVLEARVAYQDDTIETLNATITAQWKQIDGLARQLAALGERLAQAETSVAETSVAGPGFERPPHY